MGFLLLWTAAEACWELTGGPGPGLSSSKCHCERVFPTAPSSQVKEESSERFSNLLGVEQLPRSRAGAGAQVQACLQHS